MENDNNDNKPNIQTNVSIVHKGSTALSVFWGLVLFFIVLPMACCASCVSCIGITSQQSHTGK